MQYNMNNATHAVEINIDENDLAESAPMKISVNIGTASKSDIDNLMEAYKSIDHVNFSSGIDQDKFQQAGQILDKIAKVEIAHSNDLKNIALIWDHDYPIMVQGDTAGHSRWAVFTALIHTIINTYLNGESMLDVPPITEKMRSNLEHKMAMLLNLSATHDLGNPMFHPATYAEVTEEIDRITPSEQC